MKHGVYYASTDATWTLTTAAMTGAFFRLAQPFSRFTAHGEFAANTSGTFTIQGALTSDPSTSPVMITLDNTTAIGWNTTGMPMTWVRAVASTISSGTTGSISIYLAAVPG